MPKHNNVIPNAHFHKDWERFVYTWFDQAAQKRARRLARIKKAARVFPRPVSGSLRPAVRSQTFKYNNKVRAGRGFTLEELKKAGINRREARQIGISIDHRRTNKTEQGLHENVDRLKRYMAKLVIFPNRKTRTHNRREKKKAKKAGTPLPAKPAAPVVQQLRGEVLPIRQPVVKSAAKKLTRKDRKGQSAFVALRTARRDTKLIGIRKKRAEAKAAAALKKSATS